MLRRSAAQDETGHGPTRRRPANGGPMASPPVILGLHNDTGTPGDGITADSAPVLFGTATPGALVQLIARQRADRQRHRRWRGRLAGAGQCHRGGERQPDRPHQPRGRQRALPAGGGPDRTGRAGADRLRRGYHRGPVAADLADRGHHPEVTGTAEPGAIIRAFDGATLLGTARAGPGGAWTLDLGPCGSANTTPSGSRRRTAPAMSPPARGWTSGSARPRARGHRGPGPGGRQLPGRRRARLHRPVQQAGGGRQPAGRRRAGARGPGRRPAADRRLPLQPGAAPADLPAGAAGGGFGPGWDRPRPAADHRRGDPDTSNNALPAGWQGCRTSPACWSRRIWRRRW